MMIFGCDDPADLLSASDCFCAEETRGSDIAINNKEEVFMESFVYIYSIGGFIVQSR